MQNIPSHQLNPSMSPYITSQMENPIQSLPATQQLSGQGYTAQLQPTSWSGNSVRQSTQSPSIDPYSQPVNRFYQGSYAMHRNSPDVAQYGSTPNGHHMPTAAYNSQYPGSRQSSYPTSNMQQQTYPATIKPSYNPAYYGNAAQSGYPTAEPNVRQTNYANTAVFYPTKAAPQCATPSISHSPHSGSSNSGACVPQMPNHSKQHNAMPYSRYQMNNNYAGYQAEGQATFLANQKVACSNAVPSIMSPASTNSQLSSIPTPPETTGQGEMICNDAITVDGVMDCIKLNNPVSNSFVLPGSTATHISTMSFSSSNVSVISTVSNSSESSRTQQNWNSNVPVQPPANVDEGSQASSASASSSIPDDQNSAKANSKPNFSYPPTPNTLSSPGAASMSSFHDDLECTSSPGWPRTPASPVATNNSSNYEFANIKRPESLLKLYSLSDEPDRRYFLDKLIVFNEDRGSPITQCPTISKQPLDVFRVYLAVKERGGFVEVTNAKRWKDIAGAIGVGASSSAAYTLRKQYMKLLLPFECKFDRGGIDPQPIINMVEASSRKKNKNANSGSPNMGSQGYPTEGYGTSPSGYPECYPTSRYPPCHPSNVDYRYAQNPAQYHNQSMQQYASGNSNVQPQYGQYNRSYNYNYQGNNTNNQVYNTNCQQPNNTSCHYSASSASSNGNYYPTNYAPHQNYAPQSSNAYSKYGYGNQEPIRQPPNAQPNRSEVSQEQNSSYVVHGKPKNCNVMLSVKQEENSLDIAVNDNSISSDSNSLDTSITDSSQSYATGKLATQEQCPPQPVVEPCPVPKPTVSPFQQPPVTDSPKKVQSNINSAGEVPYSNSPNPCDANYASPSSYPNVYQHKTMHNQPTDYEPYTKSQSDNYRGSEGPPPPPCAPGYHQQLKYNGAMDSTEIPNAYPAQYKSGSYIPKQEPYTNCHTPGPTQYWGKNQYSPGCNKEVYNASVKPNKGWNSPVPCYQPQDHQVPVSSVPCHTTPDMKVYPEATEVAKVFNSNSELPLVETKMPPQPSMPRSNCIPPPRIQQPQSSLGPPFSLLHPVKKPIEFPPESVEAVKPVFRKRRRYSGKRVSPIDPWRVMLALKSGMLVESTWALDSLSVLLCDNSCANYFRLSHLPGLLSGLVEHYRFFLNKIFDLFNELEMNGIKCKASCRKSSLSTSKLSLEPKEKCIMGLNWLEKSKVLQSPNYTFHTRCKKSVRIRCDEALFLIDPDQKWDSYEGFSIDSNYWLAGRGEITTHIQMPMATSTGRVRFSRDMDMEESDSENDSDQEYSMVTKNFPELVEECKSKLTKLPTLLGKGEPVILLKNCSAVDSKVSEDACEAMDDSDSGDSNSTEVSEDRKSLKTEVEECTSSKASPKICTSPSQADGNDVSDATSDQVSKTSDSCSLDSSVAFPKQEEEGSSIHQETIFVPKLRYPSQKRPRLEDLEDEAYSFDQPSLNLLGEFQESLIRRCICVSNVLRNLSFIPGNDVEMAKHSCLLLVLGRLLLLHHKHKELDPTHKKYSKETDETNGEDSCISLRDDYEWWQSLLHVLRDNTLVILSNIAGQLDLALYPEEISLPILDGLLHWVVCPSSYARDPLPAKPTFSVLTPQRLSLEILCKLSVLDNNVDLMIATPPWSRIEELFKFLTKSLSPVQDKVVREFSIVLLSSLSQADSSVARTIANQSQCISYLIGFIEQTEASAFQIASTQGSKKLKDNPEIVGSTPGMVQRAASVLKNLAMVPGNLPTFFRYQNRLLTLVTSQIIDQNLATIIADVLFYCSEDAEVSQEPFLFS